jgi:spore maturation protein B
MASFGAYVIPVAILIIVCAGLIKRENVFQLFMDGAKEGIPTAVGILPALIALMTAIAMFKASGAFDMLVAGISPLCNALHVPAQVVPLGLMRPISGSGSLSLFENILRQNGPDSFVGRVASVLQGSTETTFYTVTVYYGSIGVSKTRHTLPAALSADLIGFIMSIVTVSFILY